MLFVGCQRRGVGVVQNVADVARETTIILDNSNDIDAVTVEPTIPSVSAIDREHYSGVTNNDEVSVREYPSLDADVIGQLERGMIVTVLGRSKYRMFLEGYDSFWLKISIGDIEGWAYGAFVNLLDSQYERLPVLSDTRQINIVDLNFSRNLPEYELIQKEREALMLQSGRFMDVSIQVFYDNLVRAFNQQQSLRPFFLNTQKVGFTETGFAFNLSSSSLSDFIQSSYIDNITIGPLIKINETSASFVINGFRQIPIFIGFEIGAIAVNIKRIDDVSFFPLNGKTVIDLIVVGPSAEEFIEPSSGDIDWYWFNYFMTRGTFHSRRTHFLQMILGDMPPGAHESMLRDAGILE